MPLQVWKRGGRGGEGINCCINNEGPFLINFSNEYILVGNG